MSDVARLRATSSDPITVYINSYGGGIRTLDIIEGILGCSDLDQKICLFITVAVGNAASAGANLLAFGNYAYAYDHSLIHFHGAQSRDLPDTFEDASQMAAELERLNRKISRRLSYSVIGRIIFRYQSLKSEFKRKKIKEDAPELVDLHRFLHAISTRLSPPARRLINTTYRLVKTGRALTHKILPKVVPKMGKRTSYAADDAKVLIEVLKHELSENKGKTWRLDDRGISKLTSDYFVLRDYNLGEYTSLLSDLLGIFGAEFLTPSEAKRFSKIKNGEKKVEFLFDHAAVRLNPLWYFTVSLCRQLMRGENSLTPKNAYYLGIVDEVIGTDLPGRRSVSEQAEKEAAKAAAKASSSKSSAPVSLSTNAPQQPS